MAPPILSPISSAPDPCLREINLWLSNAHRSMREEGEALGWRGVRMAGVPSGVVAQVDQFQPHLHAESGQIKGSCGCRNGQAGQKCAHQCALASVLRRVWIDRPDDLAGLSLRRAIVPPSPEETLRLLGTLLSKTTPERGRKGTAEVLWIVRNANSAIAIDLHIRDRLVSGLWGKVKAPNRNEVLALLNGSGQAQDRALGALVEEEVAELRRDLYRHSSSSPGEALGQLPVGVVLGELVGHPAVFFQDVERRLEVVSGEPALRVQREGDEWAVEASLTGTFGAGRQWPHHADGGRVATLDPEQLRLTVARASEATITTLTSIALQRMRVPLAYGPALADGLDGVGTNVKLLLPPELLGRDVPADPRVRVVFDAPPPDAVVMLRVQPFAGGAMFVPGMGPEIIRGTVAGERVAARRDLPAEVLAAARLGGLLALATAASEDGEPLDLDRALELLESLDGPEHQGLPVDWPAQAVRVLTASKVTHKVQVTSAQDWFGVGGTVEVDGETVALAKLISARRDQRKFIELAPGKYVRLARLLRPQEEKLVEVTHEERGELVLSRAVAAQADALFEDAGLTVPSAWADVVARARRARSIDVTPPATLVADLRDYQREGYAWMRRLSELGLGCVLADDMGLGKTVQAIGMLAARAAEGPQLVVCPASVGFNWQRELARFAPSLRVLDFRTCDRAKTLESAGPGDVLVTSYGLARYALAMLQPVVWATLVIDEAQTIKNWDTDTAKSIRKLQAGFRVALTGTPVENHLGELYSLVQTVARGVFPPWERFSREYAVPIEKHGDKERARQLARLVKPLLLRRTKGQVLTELPPRTEVRVDIVLPKAERALYEAARQSALEKLAGLSAEPGDGRIQVLAELTRLRQLACEPHLVVPSAPRLSAKLLRLLEELDEVLEEGHSALVFSQFVRQLELVREALEERKIGHLMLTGDTPPEERRRRVDAFQAGEAKVFLVSLKAGGTGLNLTAADYVFIIDPWWNPAVEDQAADRAHRMGQTRPVTIVRLVAKDTIEEQVVALHERKRALVAGVLGDADLAARLSTADLVDLLKIGSGAAEAEEEDATAPSPPASAKDESKPAAPLKPPAGTGAVPEGLAEALEDFRQDHAARLSPGSLATYLNGLRKLLAGLDGRGGIGGQLERCLPAALEARREAPPGTRSTQASSLGSLIDSLEKRKKLDGPAAARLKLLVRQFREYRL